MAASITDGQTYVFFNWIDRLVIDLYAASTTPGNKVIVFPGHLDVNPQNQAWKVQKVDGKFVLATTVASSGKGIVLTLAGGQPNGNVTGDTPSGGSNQSWTFESVNPGGTTPAFNIKNEATGQYITATGGAPQGTQLKCSNIGTGSDADLSRWIAVPFSA